MNGLTMRWSERRTSVPSTFQMTSPLSLIHSRDSFSLRPEVYVTACQAVPFRSHVRSRPSSVISISLDVWLLARLRQFS